MISVPSINTAATISALDLIFMTHGFPKTLVSDNGADSSVHSSSKNNTDGVVDHVRLPSYSPQSNSLAEHFVDTLKRTLLKAKEEGLAEEVTRKFILTNRATPHPMLGCKFYAELLMGITV